MRRAWIWVIAVVFCLTIAGCGGENEQAESSEGKGEHPYSQQKKALDDAKELSEMTKSVLEQKERAMNGE